jgi:diguanylate cyclase (GGDEF)-like protein
MNKSVFQSAYQKLDETLVILNTAIYNHRLWSDKLHTAMLCKQAFPQDVLHEASHTKCQFGKWYYGKVDESIHNYREYVDLEEVHRQMHDQARTLAMLSSQGKPINIEAYHRFLHKQNRLIELLNRLHQKLVEHQHSIDALTGVANRKSINMMMEQMFENARRYKRHYAVVMLDADHFKRINDQYGHMVGDQVLKKLATYLKQALRKSDGIGRYGGEEFLIFLPETSQETALEVMNNCIKGLAQQAFDIDHQPIHITASVGVSEVQEGDDDAWLAVKRADFALYKAKEAGRNRVVLAE